jgi:hypothetical protein
MKNEQECSLETLVRGKTAHVQRCVHCQSLSLHVGPVTLRFAPEAAESLWNTLGEALLVMHSAETEKKEPRLRLATMRGQGTA